MGEPSRGNALLPAAEPIGGQEATGGTETSKYPEEEKSTEIARVAASESAPAQTGERANPWGVASPGSWDQAAEGPGPSGEVTNLRGSGTAWEGRPQRVRAPYANPRRPRDLDPE